MAKIRCILALAFSSLACAALGRRTQILSRRRDHDFASQSFADLEAASKTEIARKPLHVLVLLLVAMQPATGFRSSAPGLPRRIGARRPHAPNTSPARAGLRVQARTSRVTLSAQKLDEPSGEDYVDPQDILAEFSTPRDCSDYSQPRGASTSIDRRCIVNSALAAWALLSLPQPVQAGLGSSRAAVTSFPGAPRGLNADIFSDLTTFSQERLESVLRPSELQKFLDDLKSEALSLSAQLEAFTQEDQEAAETLNMLTRGLAEIMQDTRDTRAAIAEKELQLQQLEQLEASESQKTDVVRIGLEKKRLEAKLQQLMQARAQTEKRIEAQLGKSKEITLKREQTANLREQIERNKKSQERLALRSSQLAALDAQPAWFNYVAAFTASCISTLVMYPLDTLNTQAVTGKGDDVNDNEASKPNPLERYLALYRGLGGALFKEGPPSAVYLGVYEAVKGALLANPDFAPSPLLVYLIAGALGETVGSVIRAPAEALKSRVQSGVDASLAESVEKVILDQQGRENVARAWTSSLWRDVPAGAIQLAIFEGLKEYIANSPRSFFDLDVNSLAAEVLLGSIGGAIGALVTTPPNVVTTRILTNCDKPMGFVGMGSQVLQEGGFQGLCVGWKERTGYWAPAIGIFLSCYCSIRQLAVAQNLFPPSS